MEHIIQQIALELARKITERTLFDEIYDLDLMSSLALEDCKAAAIKIIEVLIENINVAFREDKVSRLEKGILIKEHDRHRDVLTELGRIGFDRDYYYDKNRKCYVSPVDQLLNIESYDRVSKCVSAKLTEAATEFSYQKSTNIVTNGEISRQTVRNKILKAPTLEVIPPVEKREVKELHIFADEDHVHMQKPRKEKGKKSRQVPLVTVTEGVTGESRTRNCTINPVHFVEEDFSPTKLWEDTDAYIRMRYDVDKIENIYIHGDGASWIESGLSEYSNVTHVMDGYHLGKYLRAINTKFPKKNVRLRLEKTLRSNEKEKANEILESLKNEAKEEKQIIALETTKSYLNNKWEELVGRRILDIPGSCTEGQVSHVLSERFSRNPMGWSSKGLGKLSKLRVYRKNGGKIEGKHFQKNQEDNSSLIKEVTRREVSGCFDWSIFDGEPLIFDRNSGTQELIRMLGEQNNRILS